MPIAIKVGASIQHSPNLVRGNCEMISANIPSTSDKSHRSFIIGLAGPTCTGKSTVAKSIARRLGGQTISIESYYLDQGNVPVTERAKRNFDSPDALDGDLLVRHVKSLAAGEDVEVPIYDFAEHTRIPGRHERVKSSPFLIVEGILVLHWPELRMMFDKSFYLDAPSEVCLQRRKVRDIVERQRAHEFVVQQYQEKVLPMAVQYIYPTKQHADVVINATQSIDKIESELISQITSAAAAR
jgi:uridine kinase